MKHIPPQLRAFAAKTHRIVLRHIGELKAAARSDGLLTLLLTEQG